MDRNHPRKCLQQTSILSHLCVNVKKDASDDEEEKGIDNVKSEDLSDTFLCEFCDYTQNKTFPSREGLMGHCLKCHPTACLGCYEMFASSEDLLLHFKNFPHEPPVCRTCCHSFASAKAKSVHKCSDASSSSKSPVVTNEISCDVKVEPQDSDIDNRYFYESEDDLEEKVSEDDSLYEEEEEDDDDDGKEYSLDKEAFANYGSGVSMDVILHCMHCSFIARGTERTPSVTRIRRHTYKVHPTACCICFEMFDNADGLEVHQESLNHKMSGCRRCQLVFMKRSDYNRHMLSHPEQCQHRCSECSARFLIPRQLKRHKLREHPLGDYQEYQSVLPVNICTICDYSASSTYAVMMHMFEKHPEPNQIPKFKCDVCQVGFSRPNYFGRHIEKKHSEDAEFQKIYRKLVDDYSFCFECESCMTTYYYRTDFLDHLRVAHRSSMPHHCSICSLGFMDPIDLQMHEFRVHRNISPYVCDKCNNKTFKNLSRLMNHFLRVHKMTTMPYVYCFVHNVGFCSNDNASTHYVKMHKAPKKKPEWGTFKCETCGKILASKLTYQYHVAQHDSSRPYKCTECDKSYAALVSLKNHAVMHSSKHQCSVCGKTFHSEPFLKRHQVVHTGEKPFECSICGLKVSQKSALQRHMAKVHPGGIMGNPRSTKPRKCRVLSKTLEAEKSGALDVTKKPGPSVAAVPSPEANSLKFREVSKPVRVRKPKPPAVQIDTSLLKADLITKPKPILPGGARGRKRQRKIVSSEESSEDEEDDDFCSSLEKAQPDGKAKRRRTKKRKRKSNTWSRPTWSSMDEDEEKFSESDDESDAPYVPRAKEDEGYASRRSARLKELT